MTDALREERAKEFESQIGYPIGDEFYFGFEDFSGAPQYGEFTFWTTPKSYHDKNGFWLDTGVDYWGLNDLGFYQLADSVWEFDGDPKDGVTALMNFPGAIFDKTLQNKYQTDPKFDYKQYMTQVIREEKLSDVLSFKTQTIRTVETKQTLIVLGSGYNSNYDCDFKITDDESGFDIYVGGEKAQHSICDGFGSVITVDQYSDWCDMKKEEGGDDWRKYSSIEEAFLINGFTGDIGIVAKFEDGTYTDKFDINDYIWHQLDTEDGDVPDVIVSLPKGAKITKLEGGANEVIQLLRAEAISVVIDNEQNDPITGEGGESLDSKLEKVDDFLDSMSDEEKDETEKAELKFDELMEWYDKKEAEIKLEEFEEEKEREEKLEILSKQKDLAVNAEYIRRDPVDFNLPFEEQIVTLNEKIVAIEGEVEEDATDEEKKEIEDNLTEEESRVLKALKTQLAQLVYLREREEKIEKFTGTQYDFQVMTEKLNERIEKIMKNRVDEYYEDVSGIQYFEKESLQKVMDSSTDEFEEVLQELVEDTDQIALGFTVKDGAPPGTAAGDTATMCYVSINMQWAFEGDVQGEGLKHNKTWFFPTDFIRDWKKMAWLFGDETEVALEIEDETPVDDKDFKNLLKGLKSN